jgi:hypothetical protein
MAVAIRLATVLFLSLLPRSLCLQARTNWRIVELSFLYILVWQVLIKLCRHSSVHLKWENNNGHVCSVITHIHVFDIEVCVGETFGE